MTATLTPVTSPRRRVIHEVRQMIASGEFRSGQRLPSEQELAARFTVSRGTVRAGLAELAEVGEVEQRRGFGCYVGKRQPGAANAGGTLCFMVPLENSVRSLYNDILAGVETAARAAGFGVSLVSLDRGRSVEECFEQLRQLRSSGVIFSPLTVENYYEFNSRFIDLFEEKQIDYVVVDSPVARGGIIRGNFIGSDGYGATRQVVKELIRLGHRRIGSIRVFDGVYTSDLRYAGILDQLRCEGLPIDPACHLTIAQTDIHQQGRPMTHALMALPEPPTAVICTHDTLALNVIDELHQIGRRVPEEVSVFGFDDDYFAERSQLSTVRQPFREIGERAARALLETRGGPPALRKQEFLPCQLVFRGSVATAGAPCRTRAQA